MKLQILIPHYRETEEIIKCLLDSITVQQNINFQEIGVIICHDGELSPNLLFKTEYPFEIKQIRQEHRGVSAARNACLDMAEAEYVMFCDADDMFFNVCGLWTIFHEIRYGFDILISVFVEETRNQLTNEIVYVDRDVNNIFVHGKVYKRMFLLQNHIRFDECLTIHEDKYFNLLAKKLSQNIKYCHVPFYLWKWNNNSVSRRDPKFIQKTYINILDSNDALISEFLRRGMADYASFLAVVAVFDVYYTVNKLEWATKENIEYKVITEQRFVEFFKKYYDLWMSISDIAKTQISNSVRASSIVNGEKPNNITIQQWLKHIVGIEYIQ